MSDTVELIMDGVLCEQCGDVIDEEGLGYPGKCEGCE